MRRNDSSSGEMEEAVDPIPAVDSTNENTSVEVTATKPKHAKIPPPSVAAPAVAAANGVKRKSVSPQQQQQLQAGRQSRPQSANRGSGAPVRYFMIKSLIRENVERSIEQGVWSTQVSWFSLTIYVGLTALLVHVLQAFGGHVALVQSHHLAVDFVHGDCCLIDFNVLEDMPWI